MHIMRNKQFTQTNQSWLGSATGTDDASTITIDGTKLTGFADVIPAGIPLKEGTTGKFEPVAAVGDTLAGFLLTSQAVLGTEDIVAALMWHGAINVDQLPEDAFDVTTLTAGNPRFDLRKGV